MDDTRPPRGSADTAEARSGGPPALPERIGVYRVERLLGTGGMGEVFGGFDDRLGRPVAIKRIRHDAVPSPERRERLRLEARAAARLSHPAVVQVYDIVYGESSDAIVMELVMGTTLDRLLAAGAVDGATAIKLARQVAGGLAAAHAEGFLHRDLKTENVMVTAAGQAKILDFGLARPLAAGAGAKLTADGALVGTSRAMSPEQARGRELDGRSDLFSFGVLCYEMFTGYSPFRGESLPETLTNVLERRPPPARALRPELPEELSSLIEALLEKDPERRPESADQVSRSLLAIAELPAVSTLPPATLSQLGGGTSAASDAPTGSLTLPADARSPSHGRPVRAASAPALPKVAHRRRWIAAAAVLGLGLATLGLAILSVFRRPAEIAVLVLPPKIVAEAEDPKAAQLVASGVAAAASSTLASLDGVTVLEPFGDAFETPLAAAHAAAADEVLTTEVLPVEGLCRIVLKRIAAPSGQVLATRSLEVSALPRHARDLAIRLKRELSLAFSEYPSPDSRGLEVSEADYAVFIDLRRRSDSGEVLGKADLERLAALLESSPGFLEGHLYAASLATALGEMELARGFVRTAIALSPDDPEPLNLSFRIALESGQPGQAEAILARLERLVPGDIAVLASRARLLARRGELAAARDLWRTVVELRPSWRHLYWLAYVEYSLGEIADSRDHAMALLERSPGNPAGLAFLGRLELFYGSLERAEEIFLDLVASDPDDAFTHLVSLGLIRYLLGRYPEALASYRRAQELDPTSSQAGLLLRLDVASALLAMGETEEALELYRELSEELDLKGKASELAAEESMILAECLARLGRTQLAVEVTLQALQDDPEDSQITYLAALVYALVDDRRHARYYVERALDRGIQPRWFRIPAFDSLADDGWLEETLRRRSSP